MEKRMTEKQECPYCFGTGQRVVVQSVRLGRKLKRPAECPHCKGTCELPRGLRPASGSVQAPIRGPMADNKSSAYGQMHEGRVNDLPTAFDRRD